MYGLAQWDPPSKFLKAAGIESSYAARLAKHDPERLMDMQLDFLVKSMQPGGGEWLPSKSVNYGTTEKMNYEDYISSKKDPKYLASIFYSHYENQAATK